MISAVEDTEPGKNGGPIIPSKAQGEYLDNLAKSLGITREAGETDESLSARAYELTCYYGDYYGYIGLINK